MDNFFNKIQEFFLWLWDYITNSIMDGIISILSLIPVPSFLTDMQVQANSIGGMAGFWLTSFQIHTGIGIILSAYTIRFIIRTLPFVR